MSKRTLRQRIAVAPGRGCGCTSGGFCATHWAAMTSAQRQTWRERGARNWRRHRTDQPCGCTAEQECPQHQQAKRRHVPRDVS